MNIKHFCVTRFFVLITTMAVMNSALAQEDIDINYTEPSSGEQGLIKYPVDIIGSGFDDTVTDVRYILHCGKKNCPDTGDIIVNSWDVAGPNRIATEITIFDSAPVAYFDIQVKTSRGRGGKGTTYYGLNKFSVKVRPNLTIVTCNETFFGIPRGQPGPCNSVDGGECEFVLGNPERIKNMMTDCETSETIWLPNGVQLSSVTSPNTEEDYMTLTAVLPPGGTKFIGDTVIANAGHRAQVARLNIDIAADVPTCESGLKSAISFVLDEATEPPYPPDDPEYPQRATFFDVAYVGIKSHGGPLCTAMEMVRTDWYTQEYPASNGFKTRVLDNVIDPFSYSHTGIWFEGFIQQADINPPQVWSNTIGAPDCEAGGVAAGIYFGPLHRRLDGTDSEALIDENIIDMSGTTCTDTVGIVLEGDLAAATTGNLNNNYVTGAFYGVVIDAGVERANMKGNNLTANPAYSGDVGICSAIPVGEKGKPNRINGFQTPKDDKQCFYPYP